MITGYNTDVSFNGRVYHVQTEDRGLANPIVESLVYCGGEIIDSRKTSYRELVELDQVNDAILQRRMEEQHNELMREIRNGKFEPEDVMPFGHAAVSNRTFDEVVLAFLRDEATFEEILLDMVGPDVIHEGGKSSLSFTVVERESQRPVCGASIEVRLVSTGAQPQVLFSALSDADGRAEAEIDIPELPGTNAALVCAAAVSGRTASVKQLVEKRGG